MLDLSQARFLTSADQPHQFWTDRGAEVAFSGRSNAGKSSALNAIARRRDLARTSKTPGRTQLINFFALDENTRLVDLPGYGYAAVPPDMQKHWRELMEAYFTQRQSLAGLFLIVDARRGLKDTDEVMLDYAISRGRPVHVLLTKADKLTQREAAAALKATTAIVGEAGTVQLFSAVSKLGVDHARKALEQLLTSMPPA